MYQMRLLDHFTRYCHFIENMKTTSVEKILGGKLPFHWKQPDSQNYKPIVMEANNDSPSDLLTYKDDCDSLHDIEYNGIYDNIYMQLYLHFPHRQVGQIVFVPCIFSLVF